MAEKGDKLMGIITKGPNRYWRTPQIRGLHDFSIRLRPQPKVKIRLGIKDEYLIIKRYECIGADYIDHYGRIVETAMFNLKTGQIDIEKSKVMGLKAKKSSYKVGSRNYPAKLEELVKGLKRIVSYSYMGGLTKRDKDLKLIKAIIADIEKGEPIFAPRLDSDFFEE